MILQRWRQGQARAAPSGASGYRAYAVGDVHGRLDLLDRLLDQIEADHRARGGQVKPVLVFLGDLIDRGSDSCGVVERVRTGAIAGFRTLALAGNHEEVLLRLLDGEQGLFEQWLRFGGMECLNSYGEDALALAALPEPEAMERVRAAIPADHQFFLRDLGDTFRFGDYLFVHAGIRPGIPLHDQSPIDLRWMRQPFLSDRRDHGAVVVHGHIISREVEERPNRIGIDTGAYHYGVLTAVGIEGGERWFLRQVGRGQTSRMAAEQTVATAAL